MTAVRQDAWTPDDDLLLAEVVLRHIREGSTQLAAFEEVGEKLGRTAAACGFRWNSSVRKQYEAAIQIAKAQRQKQKRARVVSIKHSDFLHERNSDISRDSENDITFEDVISFLKNVRHQHGELSRRIKQLESGVHQANEELTRVREENEKLKSQCTHIQSDYHNVNDDYKTLLQIMDRARKMTLLAEKEDYEHKPKFKMDANGNLERVDK